MRDELRRTLRGATVRSDGAELVRALDGVDVADYLQLAGDGVLAAVTDGVDGAADLAGRFVAELGERLWTGDDDLAAELNAALGVGEPTGLGDLAVSLEELSEVLEDGQGEGGAINLPTGQVWPIPDFDYEAQTGEEPPDISDTAEWLVVRSDGSRPAYRDVADFIGTVTDPDTADRLAIAIDGPGAFGRFRRVLDQDDNLHTRWYGYSEERRLGRARARLTAAGYRPARTPPTGTPARTHRTPPK